MTRRITQKHLENRVSRLQQFPKIYLGSAYGMYRVEQIISSGGAIKTLSGYGSAKEIDWFLDGLFCGMKLARKEDQQGKTNEQEV